MGGIIIDFSTSCPWQLYTFSFLHLIASIFLFIFDACVFLFPTKSGSCVDSEAVMSRLLAICLLYTGVIYGVLTYHNKSYGDMITRLSNFALHSATALLCAVIYAGNAKYGGHERGWMHVGDMLTMLLLVGVLMARVSEDGVVWASKNSSGVMSGMGINCKSLLLLFTVATFVKLIALTDFIDPQGFVLAEGVKMTKLATYMWQFVAVSVLEIGFALVFALLYDDEASELMVITVASMTVVAIGALYPVTKYMGDWYDFSNNAIWIKLGVVLGICAVAVVGGRLTGSGGGRRGYSGVGEGTNLNV